MYERVKIRIMSSGCHLMTEGSSINLEKRCVLLLIYGIVARRILTKFEENRPTVLQQLVLSN